MQKLEADKNTVRRVRILLPRGKRRQAARHADRWHRADLRSIAGGKYEGSRPLFIYVKKQHIGIVPGIDKFVAEYVSAKAMSKDGYLARKGLVALPKGEADNVANNATAMKLLTEADVK